MTDKTEAVTQHAMDDALAADFVLGALEKADRVRAERRLAADPDFAALVEAWRQRLQTLSEPIAPVAPSDTVWDRIAERIAKPRA